MKPIENVVMLLKVIIGHEWNLLLLCSRVKAWSLALRFFFILFSTWKKCFRRKFEHFYISSILLFQCYSQYFTVIKKISFLQQIGLKTLKITDSQQITLRMNSKSRRDIHTFSKGKVKECVRFGGRCICDKSRVKKNAEGIQMIADN